MAWAKFTIRNTPSVVALLAISGCAINPVPGNYFPLTSPMEKEFEKSAKIQANFTTINIVRQIRCEARAAVATVTTDFLRSDIRRLQKKTNKTEFDRAFLSKVVVNGNPNFNELIKHFYWWKRNKEKPEGFQGTNGFDSRAKMLDRGDGTITLGGEIKLLENFAQSGLGYTFTFTITEDNDLSDGSLGLTFPKFGGKRTLGLGGAYKRKRKNTRVFSFAESIEDLVFDRQMFNPNKPKDVAPDLRHCNENDFNKSTRQNWHFPIYGKIGLKNTFETYAWLTLISPLGGQGITDVKEEKSRNLTDTIEFSTTVTGSATPGLLLTGAIVNPHLTSASAKLSNGRIDNHQLRLLLKPKGIGGILDQLDKERDIEANTRP